MTRPKYNFADDEAIVPSDLARLSDASLLPTLLYGTQFFIRDIDLFGIGIFIFYLRQSRAGLAEANCLLLFLFFLSAIC